MATSRKGIRIAGSQLNGERHICAFFHDKDEQLRTLLPFIVEGLAEGDKAIHFVNEKERDAHRDRLRKAGIDVEAAEERGQLDVRPWPEKRKADGTFDEDQALILIDRFLTEARAHGFRMTRLIGDMDWAIGNPRDVAALFSYEARLNAILSKHDDPVICAYDLSRYSGASVVDALRTHPIAIVAGVLQRNPFYIPPEQMLQEILEKADAARKTDE